MEDKTIQEPAFNVAFTYTPPPPLDKSAREGAAQLNQHSVAQESVTQENKCKGCFSSPTVRPNHLTFLLTNQHSLCVKRPFAQENGFYTHVVGFNQHSHLYGGVD
jgi:hypothetical protein